MSKRKQIRGLIKKVASLRDGLSDEVSQMLKTSRVSMTLESEDGLLFHTVSTPDLTIQTSEFPGDDEHLRDFRRFEKKMVAEAKKAGHKPSEVKTCIRELSKNAASAGKGNPVSVSLVLDRQEAVCVVADKCTKRWSLIAALKKSAGKNTGLAKVQKIATQLKATTMRNPRTQKPTGREIWATIKKKK